jgi:hypothetical protein
MTRSRAPYERWDEAARTHRTVERKPVRDGLREAARWRRGGFRIDRGAEVPTFRLGQVPCMGRRVNSARTGR